ncbi:elongation factor P maturation arginine rhamnosyltransferase EarP [Stenoxybacter acetivorans]|uniref:elongation factor P maturation arginine rhamnosyltransferase EarP n=1 Tax=Stenoxybacter acetivorans TaxID=422441 RepID=UPI000569481F|nr:elongation factor P maturation arginine rhamnosyltransferase EarP [Stenoxybacter acetivorans]
MLPSAWLFARIIDNYGDIGVTWRLARQLRDELDADVHLWTDNWSATRALIPALPAQETETQLNRITIHPWHNNETVAAQCRHLPPPRWLIEMFGCDVPESILTIIKQHQSLWLNWEYLTAESWAENLHTLPSLQSNGIAKYFWFMGFSDKSGGLLRESNYAQQKAVFLNNPAKRQAFHRRYRLPENHQGQLWLIFAYETPVWVHWFHTWLHIGKPMTLWLAGDTFPRSLRQAGILPNHALTQDGDSWQCGSLTLTRIPFVPQTDFDKLLWLADAAVVRGEDSFVRAQWAEIPFFWHIYPQADNAHWAKLHAFWQKAMPITIQTVQTAFQAAFAALSDELNGVTTLNNDERLHHWQTLTQYRSTHQNILNQWAQQLAEQPSAMQKLAKFTETVLK